MVSGGNIGRWLVHAVQVLVGLLIVAGLLLGLQASLPTLGVLFTPKAIDILWYAAEYNVSIDQVHIGDQPTDCDWMRAPLGGKGCHFKAIATGYNVPGDVVAGDGAPKYGHDTNTGKPIISYDNGETWAWFPGSAIPDLRIKTVEVRWEKVTE